MAFQPQCNIATLAGAKLRLEEQPVAEVDTPVSTRSAWMAPSQQISRLLRPTAPTAFGLATVIGQVAREGDLAAAPVRSEPSASAAISNERSRAA
jgi:hypothetical protein